MEIVVGFQGKEHVTAGQIGRIVAGMAGDGTYVLDTQNKLAATMQTANQVRIDTGDLVMHGRVATVETPETLTVQNGATGQKRNDLVVARYTKAASTSVESISLVVVKGTAVSYGDPSDPTINEGSILDGDSPVDVPLWRIPINGLTPGTPEQLFENVPSIDSLRDSVSQKVLFSGEAWGQVSLAEDAGAFDRLLVRFRDSDGRICQPVVARDGEDFSFVSVYSDMNGTYIKQQNNSVSGSTITRGEAWQRTLMSGAASRDSYFAVVEVVGLS